MDPNANPAPAAEPAAPVTPVAPVEPAAPAAEEAVTDDEKLLEQEDNDWDAAEKKIFPGLKKGKKKEGDKDEPADTTKETTTAETTTETTTVAPTTTDTTTVVPAETEPAQPGTASARAADREYQAQVAAVKSDVQAKLFPNFAQTLTDKNGDPITGIEDVMKYDNPRTGEPFTEEEAGMWFLSANQQLKDQVATINAQIEQVASVHLQLKDESDAIRAEYGDWLDAHTADRDELWADFESTLIKDPESGLILRSPLSLEKFYRRNLKAMVANDPTTTKTTTVAAPTTTDTTTVAVTQTTTVDPAKAEADAKAAKAAKRADRSDIYTGGEKQVEDPEDAEWGAAEKKVFGNRA